MTTIKSIQKLSEYGIFRNYTGTQTQPFPKRNLIYGWNGSGKSTLSTIFESLEERTVSSPRFQKSDFSITTESGTLLTATTLSGCSLNIRTFNQNFIKKNIDWDNSVKGILLIAEGKIQEKKELDELQQVHRASTALVAAENNTLQGLEEGVAKFLSESAKRTKTSLQVIDTKDARYFNYNKTKLEEFLKLNRLEVTKEEAILSDEDIVVQTKMARPEYKPSITPVNIQIDSKKFAAAHLRLVDLLKTSAANTAIDRLTSNGDIQSWVAEGLNIHANHESQECEFCGSALRPERQKALGEHFNKEFLDFQNRLEAADQWLEAQYLDISSCPGEGNFYDELKVDYKRGVAELFESSVSINNHIQQWHEILKRKSANQFDSSLSVEAISADSIVQFNKAAVEVQAQIDKHNAKTENFEAITKQSKQRLELHYAAREARDFGYFEKIELIGKCGARITEASAPLAAQIERLRVLTNSLANEGEGAEQFNKALHRFLGRSELTLRFKSSSFGYEIIRNNTGEHDGNLSEGEKTAIAFVYFITKLTENNNRLEDTIVVIDDPVSSFDSNHLFHCYSFLRIHCEAAMQLFVLTHNFNFYKLIRDWFEGTNKNRGAKGQPPVANFYVVESNSEIPRSSILKNADQTLVNYQSEYHYLFSRLYKFRDKASLTPDDAYLTANLSRKLLEAFFAFKYPGSRSDFAALLIKAQSDSASVTQEVREKIYRFINKYSHSAVIEISEDAAENLQGEGQSVIKEIFNWIEEADTTHYGQMKDLVSSGAP